MDNGGDTVDQPAPIEYSIEYDQPSRPGQFERRKRTIRYRLQTGQHHFNKWLDNTSIHGIVHVFKGKSRLRRLLWLLIFVGSAIGCIAILGYDIAIWARDPSTTTISFVSNEGGQTFPAVTICNLNPIRRYSAPNQTVDLLSKFANPTAKFIQNWSFTYIQSNESCNTSLNSLTTEEKRDTLWNAYSNGGHQIDDFIVYCGFAGNDGNVIQCEDILQPVLTSLGICYTFNSAYSSTGGVEYKVNRPGPMFGLNIILNVSQLEYPELSQASVGAKISVHARDTLPIPHETGLTLSPGTNNYLAIEKLEHKDDTRESSCIKVDKSSPSLSFFPSHKYSVSTCRVNALYEDYAAKCSCSPSTERSRTGQYASTRNCTIADVCCLKTEFTNFDSSPHCPPACHYFSYNVRSSYSHFLAPELAQSIALDRDTNQQDVQDNLLSLHVYFDEMRVTRLYTEYTYTFANLLADMGGLLGLFLGASVISLLEVAMLIFDFIKSLLLNPKLKKAVKDFEKKINLPDVELKGPLGEEESDDPLEKAN